MKKIQLLLIASLIFSIQGLKAQKDCGNKQTYKEWSMANPELVGKLYSNFTSRDDESTVYTIPIVVHVVWSNGFENIHDSLIYRQIEELNRFYSGNTSRSINIPFAFKDVNAGDTKIRFEFAKTDPDGFPTNGITRTQTAHGVFNDNGGPCSVNDVKKSALGGRDAWDTDNYLNIWVCDLDNGLNGIAVFPGDCPAAEGQDGVIVDYTLFGIVPTSLTGSGISTLTHEIGHYLGLFHTHGDEPLCAGDDNLADTPKQSDFGFNVSPLGNTFFPLFDVCSPSLISKGIMFMNIMDTNYDLSRYMFTDSQKTVIRNTLKPGGPRNSLVDVSNNALATSEFNVDATFKVWNTSNTSVFPSNSFRSVVRGKNGEMWAGTTNNGLYRYNDSNGTWEQEPTLTSHLVRHMVSDKNGNVFVASSQLTNSSGGGVRRFGSANSFSFTKIGSIVDGSGFNQLPSRLVNSVCIDDEGDMWAACGQHINPDASINEGGFLYADNNLLLFADGHYAGDSGLPLEDVRCLAIGTVLDGPTDNDDEIWVSVDRSCISGNCSAPYVARYNTTLGIIQYLGNVSLPGLNFDNTTGSPRVRAIHCDKSGRVWLGIATSQQGIYVKFPSSMGNANLFTFGDASLPYPAGANVNNNAIAEDFDGNIWIGTTAGLIKIDGGNIQNAARWTIYTTAQGLPSNNIRGICFDANNTMWCTTDAGIFRGLPCPEVRIKNVTNAPCLGTGFIETTSKGGDFSNTTYSWFKENNSNVFEPYPLVDPSVTANTPGTYKLIVSSNGQQCFNRKIQVAANNLYVPELSISKITACGFDIDLQNETNSVFYNIDVKDVNTNNVVYTQFVTGNGNVAISDNAISPLTSYYIDVTGTCTEDPTGTFQTIARRSRNITTLLCSPVKNIQAIDITKTSAQLTWEFNCNPAVKYRIRYINTTTNDTNTVQSTTLTKSLTNLDPSTTYHVEIRSVCDNAGAQLSPWTGFQFTTLQGCVKPNNIQVVATTANTATISWSAVNDAAQYRLRYRKIGNTNWTPIVVPAPNTSKIITGLTANSTYEFQMRTLCNTNNEFSNFTTMNGFLTAARFSEDDLIHDVSLYPNPTSGNFTVSIFSEIETLVSIKIINALGQELIIKTLNLEGGNNSIQFNESLPSGYYNIQIQNNQFSINKGLVIQR